MSYPSLSFLCRQVMEYMLGCCWHAVMSNKDYLQYGGMATATLEV